MSVEKLRPSFTFNEERIEQLKNVAPEAFADGKVNWNVLKEALGEFLEPEDADVEFFGLTWPGKREARRLASLPSQGALNPAIGEGINEDNTKNIFIEGDNLEILKLLLKSYAGRIKLIYIDPPYNKNSDAIYKDDYSEPVESYLKKLNKVDEQGKLLSTNSKSDGRFHSNWLSMIYPRLILARQLLREDGVLFVSIDDTEVHHLRMVLNEVFGDEQFVADIAVVNNLKGRNDQAHIATAHEHLLMYAKSEFISNGLPLSEEKLAEYNQVDDEGKRFQWRDLRRRGKGDSSEDRPNMFFPLYYDKQNQTLSMTRVNETDIEILPMKSDGSYGRWRWGRERVQEYIHTLKASYVERSDKWNVSHRVYLEVDGERRTSTPKSAWIGPHYSTDLGQRAFKKLLPKVNFGTAPKPIGMLKEIIYQSMGNGDICIDFFAGTGSTAHAILELNREDGANRSFILIQLPEEINNNQFNTIAEISKERIRRVVKKLRDEKAQKLPLDYGQNEDLGFKVFRLDRSSFKVWQNYSGSSLQALQQQLDMFETPLIDEWKEENLLTEIVLLQGFPLHSRVSRPEHFKQNSVILVEADEHTHRVLICLDRNIYQETINQLGLNFEDVFVCLDSALSDTAKMRLADTCNLRVI